MPIQYRSHPKVVPNLLADTKPMSLYSLTGTTGTIPEAVI